MTNRLGRAHGYILVNAVIMNRQGKMFFIQDVIWYLTLQICVIGYS